MRFPTMFVILFSLCSSALAQCENGQCRIPVRNALKQVVQGTQTVVQAQPIRSAVRGVFQSVSSVRSMGSSGSQAAGYSSSGTAYGYRSSECNCVQCHCSQQQVANCGSLGSSYGYDSDGAKINWVGAGVPLATPASESQMSSLGFRSRRASREVIVEAAVKANAEGTIDEAQLRAIKLASRSPRMLARMEDLIVEKAQSSGAYVFQLDANGDVVKSAINWEQIGDFILKIAPIIFKLIEMFALDTSPQDSSMFADQQPVNFVATVGSEFTAA